jgi:3,4-dihydroxy 2-butanone 4-phosphate synthase
MIITSSDLINIDHSELATLKKLALEGALDGEVIISCSELAESMDVSAQTISRRLRGLEKYNVIEREKTADGQRVFITNHGIGILLREHSDYTEIIEPLLRVELRGKVIDGMGKAGEFLSMPNYTEQFEDRLGYEPFPGTLNVELDDSYQYVAQRIHAVEPIRINGWEDEDRNYGPVSCYSATLAVGDDQYTQVHVLDPDRSTHGTQTIEVIAPVELRSKLELSDGDEVKLKIQPRQTRPQRTAIDRAIESFRNGEPILIHDFGGRENETDLVYPASDVTPRDISRLRNDAGGLICVALAPSVADAFDLPYFKDAVDHPAVQESDLGYDERSSFSLTVNHQNTFTGITDRDRALTISELGKAANNPSPEIFAEKFRIPGHVQLLRGSDGLLETRRGHTELGLAISEAAEREPAVVVCEMLDDETGNALSESDARNYAERHDLAFVSGKELINEFLD